MVVSFCGRRILTARSGVYKIPKRNRYMILLPEYGADLPWSNPLLKEGKMPDYHDITKSKCISTLGIQAILFEEDVQKFGDKLEKDENVDLFKDVLIPLESSHLNLQVTWGIMQTLLFGRTTLLPSSQYEHMHNRAKLVSASQLINIPIYTACKKTLEESKTELNDQQKRVLYKYILEGKLNGLDLSERDKRRFMYLCTREMIKIKEFAGKLEACTMHFKQVINNPAFMKGFPEDFLVMTAADPTKPHDGPWTVTLQPHIVNLFLEYCQDRSLRWKVYHADVTRSSVYSEQSVRTSVTLEEMRGYRKDQAEAMGYKDYVHMKLETKMASSLENIYTTMDKLLETAYPAQVYEIYELQQFANQTGIQGALKNWDIPFWRRKHRNRFYNYQEDEERKYFPLPKVLSGLFNFLETMFSVRIEESKKKLEGWHPDVLFFDIFDLRSSNGEPIAQFYLDLYAREGEKIRKDRDGGWTVHMKGRSTANGIKPLSALIFNFPPPCEDKPSLLSFSNVSALFYEFGRMLQHALTTVDYAAISGQSFLEWEAEFIANHFMKNWLYEPWVLRLISGHYETGETLPDEKIETLKNFRTHLAGYDLCRQLYLSRLDLQLHTTEEFWLGMIKRLWKQHFVMPRYDDDLHVCSFDLIFSRQWGGSYYCLFWAEMVAADLNKAFHEVPIDDLQQRKEIGERFRDTFFSLSGCYPTSELFRRFRGRDPSLKALLHSYNLYQKAAGSTKEMETELKRLR